MDNILYIGPYREFSGMGNASRAYLQSLIQTGHNISARPIFNIFKNYPIEDYNQEICELESNFSKKYHTIIQHCYPHQVCYDSRFDRNIGIVNIDSYNQTVSTTQYLDVLDTVVVGSNFARNELGKIKTRVVVIPEPINLEAITEYKNSNPQQNKNTFNFYCIMDYLSRKNLDTILLCFSKLAAYHNDIELVIKTKAHSGYDNIVKDELEFKLSQIYETLRNAGLKKPKVIIGETKLEGMYYIHHNNDCIINVSSAESFGYSVLEALAFGNNIICNKKIASAELVADDCGLLVDTETDMCLDKDRIYPIYNTINNYWQKPLCNSLLSQMNAAIYETPSEKQARQNNQIRKIEEYTIEKISEMFKVL
jgi:glycosyltransferase involved in cell wall biosynthesis